jgi:hypothetical protein
VKASRIVVGVHGIGNHRPGVTAQDAAGLISRQWSQSLATSFARAQIDMESPEIEAAYYADILNLDERQSPDSIESLNDQEKEIFWKVLLGNGVPSEVGQGILTVPLRQGLDWLCQKRGIAAGATARIISSFCREVHCYLASPSRRRACQDVVLDLISEIHPNVLIAHSLGSVVAYEALHRLNSNFHIPLLVTVGSPLGLSGAVFEFLEPKPVDDVGLRPAAVGSWINISDPGDVVALPARLGDKFAVDIHEEAHIGLFNFHSMNGYLSCGLVSAAISPFLEM